MNVPYHLGRRLKSRSKLVFTPPEKRPDTDRRNFYSSQISQHKKAPCSDDIADGTTFFSLSAEAHSSNFFVKATVQYSTLDSRFTSAIIFIRVCLISNKRGARL